MRRAIESIEPSQYEAMSYYERWTASLETLLLEKGVLIAAEIDGKVAEMEQSQGW
jgi:nitrile hydratase